ncbi:MAG: hypothetical protein R3F61_12250 [Myxococcota bacterium]
MVQSLVVVLTLLVGAGALLKGLSWARRERIVRAIDPATVVRVARGVSLRILTQGPTTLPGMNPDRANRTIGDFVLTADRFLIGSSRGVLVDVQPGRPRLRSIRSTGPGRLVIEGATPGATGPGGSYRIELVIDDAEAWASALAPFADEAQVAQIPRRAAEGRA